MNKDTDKSNRIRKVSSFLTWIVLRDISLVILLFILGWKLINPGININLKTVGFSDFLSVLLAFFAIALSAAFYFKANETSNRFYDNVYNFTKDTSEMLGRIESGFGERLWHLDEGYSGLRDRFDKIPFDLEKAKSEAEREKQEVKNKEREKLELFENLAEKAKLQEDEKKKMFSAIEEREQALMEARRDLRRLQRSIRDAETFDDISEGLRKHLERNLGRLANPKYLDAPSQILTNLFESIKQDFHPIALRDMEKANLLDTAGRLTPKGVSLLRRLIRKSI